MVDYTRKFLDISTGHLQSSTYELFDEAAQKDNKQFWVAATPYGYFLYAEESPNPEIYPEEVIEIIRYARTKDAEYILFDRDGPVIEELEWFDEMDEIAN